MEKLISAVEAMPTTYLDNPHVAARVTLVESTPQDPKHLYGRMVCGILQWMFTTNEGFSVLQEGMGMGSNLRPDFTVLRLLTKPGGELIRAMCANNSNDSKNVYGMLQVGFEVEFYRHDGHQFEAISGRMHLIDDVHNVSAWAQRIKASPMPFVNI